jgi:homoserine/homoserine lactone efflux protein
MAPHLFLEFVAASVVLMLIPGPNVALISANSIAHGPRYGLLTVAGTSTAMVPQLLLVALGLTSAMTVLSSAFAWLRWAGVAYLLYLGVRAWLEKPADLTATAPEPKRGRAIFLRGFLVSLSNPKTLFFFGAFFPQFLDAHAPLGPQIGLLSGAFLVLAVLIDSGWALLAGRFRRVLAMHGKLRNRLTGTVFIAAGLGLAAAREGS